MKWYLICICAVLGVVVIVQGVTLYRTRQYITKGEARQMLCDLMNESLNLDDHMEWAQTMWNSRLIVKHFPKDTLYLDTYMDWWGERALRLWEKWESKR